MRARQAVLPILVALAVLLPLGPAFAQTTGAIVGSVTDQTGAALPGVAVEARGPALQGVRGAQSDASGRYRLSFLPPGAYTVTFTLTGFATLSKPEVVVSLDREIDLDMAMQLKTLEEEVTVVGAPPAVDTTTASLASNLDARAIQTLPTGRNYSSVVQVAPGVSSDANPENTSQSTITVYGSTGAENVFYIDGVNTTNLEYGFQGKELNFEFIQEVDVKTGGYEAEFGKSTGGIITVITKSGGNEFHGDLFGYLDNDGLRRASKDVVSTAGQVEGFTRSDFGFDLGGYLVKDKLWFFAAYDRVQHTIESVLPGGPLAGEVVESESVRNLASAKLTWRLNDSSSLIATYLQDPREDTGAINDANHTLNGEESTYRGIQSFGGRDYALRYEGIFGNEWVVSAQVARHEEENSVGPASSAGEAVQLRDVARDFYQTGGFGLIQNKDFTRNFFGASLTRFFRGHTLKLGTEYEIQQAEVTKEMSGGQRVDMHPNPTGGPAIYNHFYWSTADATVANAPLSRLLASPEQKNTTLYLQDRWEVNEGLTFNFGIRWDRQQIIDAAGTQQIDLKKDFAPRFGFAWDPKKDHKTKVFGSYGRFYEQLPMDLVIRSFSYERQPRIINFDRSSTTPDPAAEAAFGTDSAILGGFTEPSDPDIRNQFMHEAILGFERELRPNLAVGVKAIYRTYGRVIEDFLCIDDGTYCIGNPGQGIMEEVYTLDYSRTLPAPDPERTYKGVQVDLSKRFSDHWQGLASYIFSKLDGNFDGLYSPFTNVGADPNITAAYDYYDFFTDGRDLDRITNQGPLSNDRRHQFKVSGVYITPWNLSLGLSAFARSGTPLTRYGYSDAYGRYEFFLTERGAEGRQPWSFDADLHVSYGIKMRKATLNLILDAFSVFNAQRAVLLDQRWGFDEADNALSTAANSGYGEPVLRTPPTSVRLGARISF